MYVITICSSQLLIYTYYQKKHHATITLQRHPYYSHKLITESKYVTYVLAAALPQVK